MKSFKLFFVLFVCSSVYISLENCTYQVLLRSNQLPGPSFGRRGGGGGSTFIMHIQLLSTCTKSRLEHINSLKYFEKYTCIWTLLTFLCWLGYMISSSVLYRKCSSNLDLKYYSPNIFQQYCNSNTQMHWTVWSTWVHVIFRK